MLFAFYHSVTSFIDNPLYNFCSPPKPWSCNVFISSPATFNSVSVICQPLFFVICLTSIILLYSQKYLHKPKFGDDRNLAKSSYLVWKAYQRLLRAGNLAIVWLPWRSVIKSKVSWIRGGITGFILHLICISLMYFILKKQRATHIWITLDERLQRSEWQWQWQWHEQNGTTRLLPSYNGIDDVWLWQETKTKSIV